MAEDHEIGSPDSEDDDIEASDSMSASDTRSTLQERIAHLSLPIILGAVAGIVLVAALFGYAVRGRISGDSTTAKAEAGPPVNARVVGTISGTKRASLSVTDTNGGGVIVPLGSQSFIMTARAGTPADIKPGVKVLLVTQTDKRASRVILVPADTPIGKYVGATGPGFLQFEGTVRKNRRVSTVGAVVNVATPAPVSAVRKGAPVVVFGSTRGAFFGGLRPSQVNGRAVIILR